MIKKSNDVKGVIIIKNEIESGQFSVYSQFEIHEFLNRMFERIGIKEKKCEYCLLKDSEFESNLEDLIKELKRTRNLKKINKK